MRREQKKLLHLSTTGAESGDASDGVKLYIPPRALFADETRQTVPAEARVREQMNGCGGGGVSVMKHPQQEPPSDFL